MNEARLADGAFRPKVYTVRLEQGRFALPGHVETATDPRYVLRIVFDTSPYPPRSEWRVPEMGPEALCVWDMKEFVARVRPEQEKHGSQWSQCTVA